MAAAATKSYYPSTSFGDTGYILYVHSVKDDNVYFCFRDPFDRRVSGVTFTARYGSTEHETILDALKASDLEPIYKVVETVSAPASTRKFMTDLRWLMEKTDRLRISLGDSGYFFEEGTATNGKPCFAFRDPLDRHISGVTFFPPNGLAHMAFLEAMRESNVDRVFELFDTHFDSIPKSTQELITKIKGLETNIINVDEVDCESDVDSTKADAPHFLSGRYIVATTMAPAGEPKDAHEDSKDDDAEAENGCG